MVNIRTRQYEVELDFDGSEWTVWGTGDPVPGFTYSNEGDRLKGGPVTIIQDWPEGEVGEVVVSFDIPLPTELADRC